ncbi:MAG: hypothetical protein K8F92_06425 [Hyphomicrobium sp.]|uniref:hypothetical protein n=1 Tax=Hyphomicrobium sp. TaxID=82 RepID=UPI001328DB0E|nr:hypothetical protein [Hyphomicrobium sp.]KAB2939571.1 MAG: hypothetical protein F9K20_16250 [Hyphomicrobium sp.]MBZ0209270.1 hypothetical protein [Hyphomicrobium sp.]
MQGAKRPSADELEEELDQALKATFPASDPIAIGEVSGTEPDRPLHRKPALIDKALVEELARNAAAKLDRK